VAIQAKYFKPRSDDQEPTDPTTVTTKMDESFDQGSIFSHKTIEVQNHHVPEFDSATKSTPSEIRGLKLRKKWLENQLEDL
jgi:hypothetical protein